MSAPFRNTLLRVATVALVAVAPLAFGGCPGAESPDGSAPCSASAVKWMKRAADDYAHEDLDDANDSSKKAVEGCPDSPEIRTIAARIALARLDFKTAAKALEGVAGSEAASLRARAFWYGDDLQHAAEELATALDDPDFKDPWAKKVQELAGTQGSGRHPFEVREGGSRLVEVKMPRDLGYALMVPIEIDGQPVMALVVTGVPEVILDSKARSNPGWVSLKFTSTDHPDRTLEMRDVPALVQDLTPYTANQQVPIGALLGVNLLRRLHLTFDRRADQFIVRKEEPPPPPAMTRIPVTYVRGGGMVVRMTLKKDFELTSGFWVDTGSPWTLALPDPTWKKIGIDPSGLASFGGSQHGKVTDVRLGGLDLGPVESLAAVSGVDEKLQQLDVETAGAAGIQFLTAMRVTMADGGRMLWVETDEDTSSVLAPPLPLGGAGSVSPPPPPPPSTTSSATTSPSAKATTVGTSTGTASSAPTPKATVTSAPSLKASGSNPPAPKPKPTTSSSSAKK